MSFSSSSDEPLRKGNEISRSVSNRKRKNEALLCSEALTDQDNSLHSDAESAQGPDPDARVIHGIADFKLLPIISYLTCPLCHGIFRDPVTITECLHTFCKSCLFRAFNEGLTKCMTCDFYLGSDPFKFALNDGALKDLSDKVLFPCIREKDDVAEKAFYAALGIRMKPEFEMHATEENATPIAKADDELVFTLVPDEDADDQHGLPRMDRSYIRTSGRLKIVCLKKYLLNRLKMPLTLLSSVEIVCNGTTVGNELSLAFIVRTVWDHTKQTMKLTYRMDEDYSPPGTSASY